VFTPITLWVVGVSSHNFTTRRAAKDEW